MHRTDLAGSSLLACRVIVATLAVTSAGWSAHAQNTPSADPAKTTTIHLRNVSQPNDANEIQVALRNMLDPRGKIYFVASQNVIVLQASPEQVALAQRLVDELDRPKRCYRLTYTLAQMEGSKRTGVRHVSLSVVVGQRAVLKDGSRVPVTTGTNEAGTTPLQVSYFDVGMTFDATLVDSGNGLTLKTRVEQSSLPEEKSGLGPQDPLIRQTTIESTSMLMPGKPFVLGTLEDPDGTRRLEVAVAAEPLP